MKLIDKDKVIAQIDRIKKEECPIDSYEGRCKLLWFEQFLSFLNTLEVKEVDLKKEVKGWKEEHCVYGMDELHFIFAKHFYELGLKHGKENKSWN